METKGLKILITGASGFIGSFLCEEALRSGMDVWAAMRKRSSRKWLQNEWLKFCVLDLSDKAALKDQMARHKARNGRWDVVIHAAGATKCLRREDFDKHNYLCTRNLAEALIELDMAPRQFIYMSSLSVLGPIREERTSPHTPLTDSRMSGSEAFVKRYTVQASVYEPMLVTDEPKPTTAYGMSKVKSEEFLRSLTYEDADGNTAAFPTVILRPTGVYGPREKDYFMMAKSIKSHVDFAVGFKPQEITFVHVHDLVGATFAAIRKGATGRTYLVSDGYTYTSRAFSDLIQRELGVKSLLRVKAPLWVLRAVSAVAESFSKLTKRPSTLNGDKCRIMSQRNWQCDITPMIDELGYVPQWDLERGVTETIKWYKREKWL